MAKQSEKVIDRYTDAEALEDGFLVAVNEPPVNRVTRAVFDQFSNPIGAPPAVVIDITPLLKVIRTMLTIEADADGWRVGEYEGAKLWLIPNEVGGLTLMFPEDY